MKQSQSRNWFSHKQVWTATATSIEASELDERFGTVADASTRSQVGVLEKRAKRLKRTATGLVVLGVLSLGGGSYFAHKATVSAPTTTLETVHVPVELTATLPKSSTTTYEKGGSPFSSGPSDVSGALDSMVGIMTGPFMWALCFGFALLGGLMVLLTGNLSNLKLLLLPVMMGVTTTMVKGITGSDVEPQEQTVSAFERYEKARDAGDTQALAAMFSSANNAAADYVAAQASLSGSGKASQRVIRSVQYLRDHKEQPGFTPEGNVTYALEMAVDGKPVLPLSIDYVSRAQQAVAAALRMGTFLTWQAWIALPIGLAIAFIGWQLRNRVRRIKEITLAH